MTTLLTHRAAAVAALLLVAGPATAGATDPHSFARPDEAVVTGLHLDLAVDFTTRELAGHALLQVEAAPGARELWLDTMGLHVEGAQLADGTPLAHRLGEPVEFLGRPLVVEIPGGDCAVRIDYRTRPDAAALLWLDPAQTAGGEHPFLFSQSQTVFARSWIPVQDSPGIRFPFTATIRVPEGLVALMSAENPGTPLGDGAWSFTMEQPVPAYLLALAVGELEFAAVDERVGVWAEPGLLQRAAWEFADTPRMMEVAEELYGPYPWGRYDLLVLPPYFPFGGMENPRLTFVTPTILAGDRSLVSLVAHELAHSWSGNLVTNATWEDFWLNEGTTVYLERRIMEALEGAPYAGMLALLGRQDLTEELDRLGHDNPLTALHVDMEGVDPEESMTDIAYEKGYFFLRRIEEAVGRAAFDRFLAGWFDRHRFGSATTTTFLEELGAAFPAELAGVVDLRRWAYATGLPADSPRPGSAAFEQVDAQLAAWHRGRPAGELEVEGWTSHQWLHFLRGLPEGLPVARMAELDGAFAFSTSGNSELLNEWFQLSVQAWYEPAFPHMERFLEDMGRRKFLRPIYAELARTPEGMDLACSIYQRARPHYHPLSTRTIDAIVRCEETGR